MGNIKFTPVKLIDFFLALICFTLVISLENSAAEQKSVIQYSELQKSSAESGLPESDEINNTSQKLSSPGTTEKKGGNSILRIFLKKEKIDKLKHHLIEYGNNHLPQNIRSLYISVIEIASDNAIIFVFTGLTLFLIINLTFVMVVLNYTIQRKNHKARYIRIFNSMYEEVLLAYLFSHITWDKALIKLKRKNKRANRKILISILLNFKTNFKGELEQFVQDIYLNLNLHQDSLKLAHSVNNFKKVQGIKELTHLYPEGAKDLTAKLINDPEKYVRAEAQTAYIRLNHETPFNFFYTLEKPFSKWTQLSAFNLIRLHHLSVPSFEQFLEFKNPYIQSFSLRMITYFQQLENVPGILKTVESSNIRIRFLAYRAINDLRLYDSRELLKTKYNNENEKNRIEIVKAFRNIGNADDFDFLITVMKQESITLKTEACRAMYFMSMESREKLMAIQSSEIPDIELLVAHVTDPRN